MSIRDRNPFLGDSLASAYETTLLLLGDRRSFTYPLPYKRRIYKFAGSWRVMIFPFSYTFYTWEDALKFALEGKQ